MPRETLGYTRLEWVCPNCASRNPGPFKFCSGCGAPQPAGVKFEEPAQDQLITDEKELAAAKAGADRYCGYCGARNPASASVCVQCGADLSGAKERASGAVVGALHDQAVPDVTCPACGAPNPAAALNCAKCGTALKRPAAAPFAPPAKMRIPWWVFALGGTFLVGLCLLVFLLTRTSAKTGLVESVNWQRSIAVEALTDVTRADWKDKIPAGTAIGSCEQRLFTTQDQPADNAKKVCGTPYKVDKGNGYSEVVQDCQYEIYKDYCQYKAKDWAVVDTAVLKGTDLNPVWPQITLQTGQRQGSQAESYKVRFSVDSATLEYDPPDEATFRQCQIGSRWTLQVNALNVITEIQAKP